MKFCITLISLLLCCGLIMAQSECPTICPAVFSPVCGEATINGQVVRCQFSNSCQMGVSACTKNINWRSSGCGYTSPNCASLTS